MVEVFVNKIVIFYIVDIRIELGMVIIIYNGNGYFVCIWNWLKKNIILLLYLNLYFNK